MSSADITCWPGTRIVKSRGNAFDLSLPGLIDWSPFYSKKKPPSAAAALADIPPEQQFAVSEVGAQRQRERRLRQATALKPAEQCIDLPGSLPRHGRPQHLHRARAKA